MERAILSGDVASFEEKIGPNLKAENAFRKRLDIAVY